jgi:hypothetical protein
VAHRIAVAGDRGKNRCAAGVGDRGV